MKKNNAIKNPTPFQLSRYVAFFIAMLATALTFILHKIGLSNGWFYAVFFVFCLVLITSVVQWALYTYIYNKIKLIYKTIHTLKGRHQEKMAALNPREDLMGRVETEVQDWAKSQTLQIEELKQQEEYRRNFLGNVSHELKTPIFNIQGYLETLLEGGIRDENIHLPYLQRAASNVERLISIVQDLETLAHLELDNEQLDMRPFNIKDLVLEVFEDMAIKALQKDIRLQLKEGASQGFAILADRERIRQVLMNLISNSIKYGKQNGRTNVGFYDMDRYILVEVSDNGIGIAEEHLNRVFERFYRVDKSRSRDQGGTGLGLSIVKHIMEAHKQSVGVRSSPSKGTTFGFTLQKNG